MEQGLTKVPGGMNGASLQVRKESCCALKFMLKLSAANPRRSPDVKFLGQTLTMMVALSLHVYSLGHGIKWLNNKKCGAAFFRRLQGKWCRQRCAKHGYQGITYYVPVESLKCTDRVLIVLQNNEGEKASLAIDDYDTSPSVLWYLPC